MDWARYFHESIQINQVEKLIIIGLALSPLQFDLYPLEYVCTDRTTDNDGWYVKDGILIDICIGRTTNDLKEIAFRYYAQQFGKSPREAWPLKTPEPELKDAIAIALEVFQSHIQV